MYYILDKMYKIFLDDILFEFYSRRNSIRDSKHDLRIFG